jgi:hypothetical protein
VYDVVIVQLMLEIWKIEFSGEIIKQAIVNQYYWFYHHALEATLVFASPMVRAAML